MLASFIFGLAAGWFAPKVDPHAKGAMENLLRSEKPVEETELRLISFALCILAAAMLVSLFGKPHAIALALGALLGVLAPRLQEVYRKSRNPDYDS